MAATKTADTTVLAKSGAWKFKATLGVVGIVSIVILAFMFRMEVGYVMLAAGSVGLLRGLVWVNEKRQIGNENLRRIRAENKMIELDADLRAEQLEQERQRTDELRLRKFIIETRFGVFRFPDANSEPRYYAPTATERKQLAAGNVIDATPQIDLFDIIADGKQGYAVQGAQQVGKTTLVMHITDYLTTRNLGQCIVVGTKMEPGEYPNCKQFIGETAIRRALSGLLEMVEERHAKTIRAPRLNIILDDWINQAVVAGDIAEEFFIHAATDMLSAGMVPYFLLQSDANSDWGNKHGARLKNNFVKIQLTPRRIKGKVIPELTTAMVIWPGERGENPVRLPGGLPQVGPDYKQRSPAIDLDQLPDLINGQYPTETEAKIMELANQGKSDSYIARAVLKHDGGNQINDVRDIINRFNGGSHATNI